MGSLITLNRGLGYPFGLKNVKSTLHKLSYFVTRYVIRYLLACLEILAKLAVNFLRQSNASFLVGSKYI